MGLLGICSKKTAFKCIRKLSVAKLFSQIECRFFSKDSSQIKCRFFKEFVCVVEIATLKKADPPLPNQRVVRKLSVVFSSLTYSGSSPVPVLSETSCLNTLKGWIFPFHLRSN